MDFKIKVFRFDSKKDYNEYYQSLEISVDENLELKNLMQKIEESLEDFSYDKNSFGFRINNKVIFHNIKLLDLQNHFGNSLEINPISTKYAKKDLLINKEAIFNKYKPLLDKFTFLSEESKSEFKKYILINLISPLDLDDYIGDGFVMYIKWMMIHYKDNKKELLDSISSLESGAINSISLENMIYPSDNSIDLEIKSVQSELLEEKSKFFNRNKFAKMISLVESKYKIIPQDSKK